ncbi:MAG TPA: hypothetical protein VMS99_11805 [Acidimicrobiia bacterium]|nr:hypothetical protein [Acidimicrobiia bacterium]
MRAFHSPFLHRLDYEVIEWDGDWLATVRIWLFMQLEPSCTYIACVGRVDPGRVKAATGGWVPLGQGGIGSALTRVLPRYISTTIVGKPDPDRVSPIVDELNTVVGATRTRLNTENADFRGTPRSA